MKWFKPVTYAIELGKDCLGSRFADVESAVGWCARDVSMGEGTPASCARKDLDKQPCVDAEDD